MKKGVVLILFLVFSFSLVSSLDLELSEAFDKNEKVDVIVVFKSNPSSEVLSELVNVGAGVRKRLDLVDGVVISVPRHVAEKIELRNDVGSIELDYKVESCLDFSAEQIYADKVWDLNISGKGVDVAILDTGIDSSNFFLDVEKEVDFTLEGVQDLNGHGTHIAGIVASTNLPYRGISYGADLFNVKVLNQQGFGTASQVISGIEWAVNNGAEIISLSLGASLENCDGSDVLSLAVDKAFSEGVLVVVSAGNNGPDFGTITSPGCAKNALTVGAIDNLNEIALFSSRGPTYDGRIKPDVVAPGVLISSTWNNGDFSVLSGTSVSSPHVSGLAALLLEIDPSLSATELKSIIKDSADDLNVDSTSQGKGMVNAYSSYLLVINSSLSNFTSDNETFYENRTKIPPGLERILSGNVLDIPPGLRKKPVSFWSKFDLEDVFYKVELALTLSEIERARKKEEYAKAKLEEVENSLKEKNFEKAQYYYSVYKENLEEIKEINEEIIKEVEDSEVLKKDKEDSSEDFSSSKSSNRKGKDSSKEEPISDERDSDSGKSSSKVNSGVSSNSEKSSLGKGSSSSSSKSSSKANSGSSSSSGNSFLSNGKGVTGRIISFFENLF
jgi:hypothetical protein